MSSGLAMRSTRRWVGGRCLVGYRCVCGGSGGGETEEPVIPDHGQAMVQDESQQLHSQSACVMSYLG